MKRTLWTFGTGHWASAGGGVLLALVTATMLADMGTVSAASSSEAQNWPQWRGPLQNGVAPQGNPPTEWSETKNVKWKVKIPGAGSSTPIIWEDKVFVLTAIPTGKKVEPSPSTGNEQNPRPETTAQGGADQPGQTRGSPGGPGGRGGPGGGFGPGTMLGQRMVAAADKNDDQRVSREEFTGLADAWFDKLDTDKSGKLDQEKFAERFSGILGPAPERGAGGGGGSGGSGGPGGRRGGGTRAIAPGFFGAADSNKDGSLTREEFKNTFTKWYTEWDADKTGALTEGKLREGLNAVLPRSESGGFGGGRGGFGGGQKPTEVHQFVILCLDRKTGKTLWQQTAREEVPHEGHHRSDGTFASSSPVTDGRNVFAYFGSRGLHSYDMNGKQQWSQDFGDMRIKNSFGEGSSPTLYEDTLIVNWDHEGDDFIAALDKKTGQPRWKQPRTESTSWSTPVVIEHDGKAQIITAASGKVRSYDLATGKLLWECGGLGSNVIPTPVTGHGMVFVMSGHERPKLLAIRLGRAGDLTGTDAVAWSLDKGTSYVPSPLLHGGYLFFLSRSSGRLSCLDARSGRAHFEAEEVEGLQNVYASPVLAGGRIYLTSRTGTTILIKPSDKLEKLGANQLEEKFDASPAIAGKDLFLRGREYLYCLAEK